MRTVDVRLEPGLLEALGRFTDPGIAEPRPRDEALHHRTPRAEPSSEHGCPIRVPYDPSLWEIVPAVHHTDWTYEEDVQITEPSPPTCHGNTRTRERPLILEINDHGNCTLSLRIPAWRIVDPSTTTIAAIKDSIHDQHPYAEELYLDTDIEVPESPDPLTRHTALEGRTSDEPLWLELVRGNWVTVQPIPATQALWSCV